MSSEHPTIGYFTSTIGESVSQAMWSGVVDAARGRSVNLICFAGEELSAGGEPSSPSSVAYDLASTRYLDGLVSWTSTVGRGLTEGEIVDFYRRYHPLPVVGLTLPLTGIPTVLIDSYRGMRDMIAHLVEFHGHRRLAFIQGPEDHYYAQERYRAYTDALEAYGISLNPRLVTTPSEFAISTGAKGIQLLLDMRKLRPGVDFDAIVTASDLLALGALDELHRRDIRVPQEVALVGFNDRADSRFTTPSLTSVRLPFYQQGYRAVELLLALLADEEVPQRVSLPARLKVRQSCGCLPPAVTRAATEPLPNSLRFEEGETFEAALRARRDLIITEVAQAAGDAAERLTPGWAESLVDVFAGEITATESEGAFLRELDHLLLEVISTDGRVGDWQDVVSALRCHALPCFGEGDVRKLLRAQDLYEQARVLIGGAAERVRGYQMMQRISRTRALRRVSRALVGAFDMAELASVLAEGLPSLGIRRCYLSLYEDPHDPISLSRLILAFDELGRADLGIGESTFSSDRLVPFELLDRQGSDRVYHLVLEPLCFQDERLGFVLFDIGPEDGTVYETLRDQISSSLKGDLLLDEIRRAQATAEEARIAAEKADTIKTRLLANVSHELRTPLNVIIGCAREATTSSEPYGVCLPDELLDDLVHIHHSAEHQLRLINDLLDLSRAEIDELDLYLRILDPRSLLETVFHSMAGTGSQSDVTWRLQLPDRLPSIQADPVRLRQILFNLLSNADKFVEEGEIALGAEVTPPNLHLWVKDTGPGIPAEMQERIFEPFASIEDVSRRRKGVGLGLSITRRLVLLHGGSMALESQPGQGSTFHVYLPLPTLDERSLDFSATVQPVLLLISSHDQPPDEIIEFGRRQELEIHHLRASDDLDAVVQRQQPAALAWDMTDAQLGDWVLLRRLRNHPQLSQAPFILYGREGGRETRLGVGMTNFVAKPTDGDTLMEAIDAVCPSEGLGPILIVDDDPQILNLYRRVVEDECPGYSIHTASNGAEAVSLMREQVPSLVILDLMMPEVNGFDVLDWMRKVDQTRQVPVLVLSSRLLSFDDVKRIEQHAHVTLQSKEVLSTDETAVALSRVMFDADALPQQTSALVKRAVAYFHQNYEHALSRVQIAEAIGVSEDYFSRIFRQEMHISPWEYLNRYRVLKAKELLRRTSYAVKIVARRVGFKSSSYFSRVFRSVTGTSPSAYREEPE